MDQVYKEEAMAKYFLSLHSAGSEDSGHMTNDEMQLYMKRISALEEEMTSTGTFVFGGALHPPSTATVVRSSGGDVLTTDGPFAETKEHLGGFYIIEADNLDAALAWASKVTNVVGKPIEVRPFRAVSGEE